MGWTILHVLNRTVGFPECPWMSEFSMQTVGGSMAGRNNSSRLFFTASSGAERGGPPSGMGIMVDESPRGLPVRHQGESQNGTFKRDE